MSQTHESRPLAQGERLPEEDVTNVNDQRTPVGDAVTNSPNSRDIENALSAAGCDYRPAENRWKCPVHGGHALAVTRQADRDLIHCHKGCKPEAVLSALGMRFADLEHGTEPTPGPVPEWAGQPYVRPGKPREYSYTDEDGERLYRVFRHEPKAFKQQAADGSWTIKDVRRVLYRLPAVLAAVEAGRTIHLAEGEKAADALHASGEVSTCNSGGSAGWRDELADALKGAAEVIVWQDRDDAGVKWAAAVGESLKARGVPYRVVQSRTEAPADDAWDHLAAGWSAEQAVPVEQAVDPVERLLSELLDSSGLDDIPSPEPLISGWLTLDTLCRINGEPGAGKSFTALDWAGHVGTGLRWNGHAVTQGPVVYLVAEGARGFKKRVRAWEQHHRRRMANVYFLPRPVQVMGEEWDTFRSLCARVRPVLIVVDTQSRVTVGVEENSNTDMGRVVERMEALRADTGACVLLAHHTPKGGEGGRGAGAITGAINTEFMASKKRNGSTVVTLENTKEKDEAEGSKLRFEMRVIELDPQPGADPFETETSVVLVPEEREQPDGAAEVDLSVPAGTNALEKLRILVRRVWGSGGTFTKAEAQGVVVRDAKAMTRATFHSKWKELVTEGFIRAELSESGRELSRFRLDTASGG